MENKKLTCMSIDELQKLLKKIEDILPGEAKKSCHPMYYHTSYGHIYSLKRQIEDYISIRKHDEETIKRDSEIKELLRGYDFDIREAKILRGISIISLKLLINLLKERLKDTHILLAYNLNNNDDILDNIGRIKYTITSLEEIIENRG